MKLKVLSAYLSVVLVWSTTPLAIKWSNSSLNFMAAVTARMFEDLERVRQLMRRA